MPNPQSNPPDAAAPKRELLLLAGLALIVFLIYAQTLTGPFVFDDKSNIRDNPHIRLTRISWKALQTAARESSERNRPVANVSFALNYYFNHYNVVGYHLVNILIHITNGILLYLLTQATLRTPALHARYTRVKWVPFFTAGIWMVHPLQTQSVAY
ncbi:MAG: hypothetical protein JSW39_16185, partial [Desulfobacterales bacterium]